MNDMLARAGRRLWSERDRHARARLFVYVVFLVVLVGAGEAGLFRGVAGDVALMALMTVYLATLAALIESPGGGTLFAVAGVVGLGVIMVVDRVASARGHDLRAAEAAGGLVSLVLLGYGVARGRAGAGRGPLTGRG